MKTSIMKAIIFTSLVIATALSSCNRVTQTSTSDLLVTPKITSTPTPTVSALLQKPATATPTPGSTATPTLAPIDGEPSVTAMTIDDDNILWLATDDDLIRWDMTAGKYNRYPYDNLIISPSMNYVSSIMSMADGSIMLITQFGKAVVFKDGDWTTIIDKQALIFAVSINKQLDGTLWISLSYFGGFQYTGNSLKPVRIPDHFVCGYASLLEGNGDLWAIDGLCMKSGTRMRQYDDGKWTEIEGYDPEALLLDPQGNVWFWDSGVGLVRADLSEKLETPVREYYSSSNWFAFAPDGSFWLAGYADGVYHYVNGQWEYIKLSHPVERITSLVVGSDNRVYVATNGFGVFVYETGTWSRHLLP